MKLMPCPLNGPRSISEFVCGGEVRAMPDSASVSDEEWARHVFLQDNPAGVVREWWCHASTAYWFIAERDKRTDTILKTYPADTVYAERVEFPDR